MPLIHGVKFVELAKLLVGPPIRLVTLLGVAVTAAFAVICIVLFSMGAVVFCIDDVAFFMPRFCGAITMPR